MDALVDAAVRAVEQACKLVVVELKDASADEAEAKRRRIDDAARDFASALAVIDSALPMSQARVLGEIAALRKELEAKAALLARLKADRAQWLIQLGQSTVEEAENSDIDFDALGLITDSP